MVNFFNTINYLATQMNNETSFKQNNKESSSVFFSDEVPSGISSSGCERCLFGLPANCSLSVDPPKKGLEKIVLERKKELMRSAS